MKNNSLYVITGKEDFGSGRINVTKAVVLNGIYFLKSSFIEFIHLLIAKKYMTEVLEISGIVPDMSKDHPRNLVAVFVCVPILMIGIFVSFLVVLYYRRYIYSFL